MRKLKRNFLNQKGQAGGFFAGKKGFYLICDANAAAFPVSVSLAYPNVMVSEFIDRLCDPRLSMEEAERFSERFLKSLHSLKKRAVVVGFLNSKRVPNNRRHLVMQLLNAAKQVVTPPTRHTVFKKMEMWIRSVHRKWNSVRGDIEGNDTPLSPCSLSNRRRLEHFGKLLAVR